MILESIQLIVPPDSPLVALVQQGVEAASTIIAAAPMADNHRSESSGGNRLNDRAKTARSEATSSADGNMHLANNDMHWWITQD
jgi:hypothetical protein